MKKKISRQTAVRKKIKKSDSVIVIAKTPMQEIIRQIEAAKQVKERLKHTLEKELPEKKKHGIKPKVLKKPEVTPKAKVLKKPDEVTSDLYRKGLQESHLDYGKLFDYLGSGSDAYSRYIKGLEYKKEMVHEHSYELGEEKLERMLRQEITNRMLFGRDGVKEIDNITEKERFDYWKQFNVMWVMTKVDLMKLGYR